MNQPPTNPRPEPFYYNDLFLIVSLFCCWPVGLLLMWTGDKWTQPIRIGVTATFALLMVVGLLAGPPEPRTRAVAESREVEDGAKEPGVSAPQAVEVETISESCQELSAMFGAGSKLSEVQKEELWKKYKGKRFDWPLEVSEVHSGVFGGYTVQFKCSPTSDSLLYDIQVDYKGSAKDTVVRLMKGESYQVKGRLKRSGSIIGLHGEAE